MVPSGTAAIEALEEMRAAQQHAQKTQEKVPEGEEVATPLRKRSRASSPAPTSVRGSLPSSSPAAPGPSTMHRNKPTKPAIGFAVAAVLVVVVAAVAIATAMVKAPRVAAQKIDPIASATPAPPPPPVAITVPELPQPPETTLPQRVSAALGCKESRANVLDVLAGFPYEFGGGLLLESDQSFYRLPRLAFHASKAAKEAELHGGTPLGEVWEDLCRTVINILSYGGGWPELSRIRLEAAVNSTCLTASTCAASTSEQLAAQVDEAFTTKGATTGGWVHQTIMSVASATGLKRWVARADLYQSRPAAVVTSQAPPDAAGDCLALRGNASLALRLSKEGLVSAVSLHQPHRWTAQKPRSLPRRFDVYGDVLQDLKIAEKPYSTFLGSFEYSIAAPASQAFVFEPTKVTGLRLVFDGPGWGGEYICLYRVSVYEGSGPYCSGNHLLFVA